MTKEPGPMTEATKDFLATNPPASEMKRVTRALETAHTDFGEALLEIYRHIPEPDGPGPCGILREFGG